MFFGQSLFAKDSGDSIGVRCPGLISSVPITIVRSGDSWQPRELSLNDKGKWQRAPAEKASDRSLQIETARAGDWPTIRRIVIAALPDLPFLKPLRESHVDAGFRKYFAEFWIGPYQELVPEWTFVIRDPASDRVVGYLVGAPDTKKFEANKKLTHNKKLLEDARAGVYGPASESALMREHQDSAQRGLELEGIRNKFAREVWDRVEREYPAHLHMNMDPDFKEGGLGSAVLEEYLQRLRSSGVPGVLLGCSSRAYGFYEKLGFHIVDKVEAGTGGDGKKLYSYILGKKL